MNNREQKSAIYSFYPKNVLPYGQERDVQLNSENIKANSLNNVFTQLVDNDRYLERNTMVAANRQTGPKTVDSGDVQSLLDGTKVFDSSASDQTSILRKVERSLQDSLDTVMPGKVNLLHNKANMMLVGTDFGLFCTNDGVNYSEIPEQTGELAFTEGGLERGSSAVTSIYTHGFDTLVGMGGNLYILVQNDDGQHSMHRVNVHNFGGDVRDVMYIQGVGTLLVATTDGLFRLDGVETLAQLQETTSDRFYAVVQRDLSGSARHFADFCLMTPQTTEAGTVDDVVIASNGGILSAFQDNQSLVGYRKIFGGTGVYFMDSTPGGDVVGTDEGVYSAAGVPLIETGYPVVDYCAVGDDRFYFVDSKVISAQFNADGTVDTADFTTAGYAGYAKSMFTVDIPGTPESLVVVLNDEGRLFTFLPSRQISRTYMVSGVVDAECAGGCMYAGMSSDISAFSLDGLALTESPFTISSGRYGMFADTSAFLSDEVLKISEDDGRAVILARNRILTADSEGYVTAVFTPGSGTYGGAFRFDDNPIAYDIVGSNDELTTVNFTYAAVRTGDQLAYIDFFTDPVGETPLSATLSVEMTNGFQTLNDIKVNQDYVLVLASDKLMYSRVEQVADGIARVMSSPGTVAGLECSELPLEPDSGNSIAYSDGKLYLLSSGTVFGMDGRFRYRQVDPVSADPLVELSNVSCALPMPDMSSFVVLDKQGNLSGIRYFGEPTYAVSSIGTFTSVRSVNTSPRGSNPGYFYVAHTDGYDVYDAANFSHVESYPEQGKNFCAVIQDFVVDTAKVSSFVEHYGQGSDAYDVELERDIISTAHCYSLVVSESEICCNVLSVRMLSSDQLLDHPPENIIDSQTNINEISNLTSIAYKYAEGTAVIAVSGVKNAMLFGDQLVVNTGSQICAVGFELTPSGATVDVNHTTEVLFNGTVRYFDDIDNRIQVSQGGNTRWYCISGGVDGLVGLGELDMKLDETAEFCTDTTNFMVYVTSSDNEDMFLSAFGYDLDGYDSFAVVSNKKLYVSNTFQELVEDTVYGDDVAKMVDDQGFVYMLSSTTDASGQVKSQTVVQLFGTGQDPSSVAHYDGEVDDFFRDVGYSYAVSAGQLFKSDDEVNYSLPELSSFASDINHIQRVAGATLFSTDEGIYRTQFQQMQNNNFGYMAEFGFTGEILDVACSRSSPSADVVVRGDSSTLSVFRVDPTVGTQARISLGGYDEFNAIAPFDDKLVDGYSLFSVESNQISAVLDGQYTACPVDCDASSLVKCQRTDSETVVFTLDGIHSFRYVGSQTGFKVAYSYTDISSFGQQVRMDDGRYLLPTNIGLLILDPTGDLAPQAATYTLTGDVGAVYAYKPDTTTTYVAGNGGDVATSDSSLHFSKVMSTGSRVNSIYVRNDHEYYMATDGGLMRTSYKYDMVDDVHNFSEVELNEIFQECLSGLQADLDAAMDEHKLAYHAEDSFITRVNNELLSVDFGGVDLRGWISYGQNASGTENVVENDVVYSMDFGKGPDGELTVQVDNFLVSSDAANYSYIRKTWYSGINELMIYLPTTNTYYIAHVDGSPDCIVDRLAKFQRANLVQFGDEASRIDSTVAGHQTNIRVRIPESLMERLDDIMAVEINGNSLPLKIYKDDTFKYQEGDAADMFHSMALPSEVVQVPAGVEDKADDIYTFRFACFGQDAQAIRILYYDSESRVDPDSIVLRYNANGGMGSMSEQLVRIGADYKRLRKCAFTQPKLSNRMFAGWGFSPMDTSVMIYDRDKFDWRNYRRELGLGPDESPKPGTVVNLYAIWLEYNEADGFTELVMEVK